MNIENKKIDPRIEEAINNSCYGLNAEDFFINKILLPIKQSRDKEKGTINKGDRELLHSYLENLGEKLVPTTSLIEHMEFLSNTKNSDLLSELNNKLAILFTPNFLLWTINNCSDNLAKSLSFGMTKQINLHNYAAQDIVDNLAIVKNDNNKRILLSEILLTKNVKSYALLKSNIKLTEIEENILIENILVKDTDSMLLHRDKIKEIISKTVTDKQWNKFDSQIRVLSVNKLDFLLDILIETKNEQSSDKHKQQADTAIYKLIDRALYTKKTDLIDRVILIKQEQPTVADIDIYVLMIKRFYLYLKKEKAQEYFQKIMQTAKQNNEFDELKTILFSNIEKYPIKHLLIEVNFQDPYFKKEMKNHFVNYLDEKLVRKNVYTKPNKI